jgi:hypothetical protein
MDNNPFDDISDPFDRLEEIEIVQMGQGMAMSEMSRQVMEHSQLGVKISQSLIELVRHIDVLMSKISELEYRLEQLESK